MSKISVSKKTTIKVLVTTMVGILTTNILYCLLLPQVLIMEKELTYEFYSKTLFLTFTVGSLAAFSVYLFYRKIEKAIKSVENGIKLLNSDYKAIEKSFKNIDVFLFFVGSLSYIFAIILNVVLILITGKELIIRLWLYRTVLGTTYGLLNGLVVGRLINYSLIDAKNLLNIHFLEEKNNLTKTKTKLLFPSILLLFVNISFLVVASLNFFEKYAFTFLKFSFVLKYFLTLTLKFIIIDIIIFYSIILEHQKHIDHLSNQFDIMANQEMDLSKRVNIVSLDEIGKMISNINIILSKLQESFIKIAEAENKVSDLSTKTKDVFANLKEQSIILNEIIKSVQQIGDNENKTIEKVNSDFKNLILAIENTVSKYKYQGEFIEKTSISLKNILNSFQYISRLTLESSQLFENLASNIYKGENEVNKLASLNNKIIESNNKIQDITKLILDISERSGLLAMNAAIEAAHAGDAGVGFSVVAEEMRKLAEKTSNSAQQIEQIVKSIIESNTEVEEANKAIEKLFLDIHNQLKETDTKIKQLAKNNEEQTTQIDKNIVEVEQLVTINEEIKETNQKIIDLQPIVIASLKHLQESTKLLLENNKKMIDTIEKVSENVEFASSSFEKTAAAIFNLKEILMNYNIGDSQKLIESEKNK